MKNGGIGWIALAILLGFVAALGGLLNAYPPNSADGDMAAIGFGGIVLLFIVAGLCLEAYRTKLREATALNAKLNEEMFITVMHPTDPGRLIANLRICGGKVEKLGGEAAVVDHR